MATIVRLPLENASAGANPWDAVASLVVTWALAEGIELRDACVLLPFAQLLPEGRRAFARTGGWMPRVETTKTLAAGLGPPTAAQSGQITFDVTTDLMSANSLLRSQTWGAAWARRDPRGFDQAANSLVRTAHELARGAFAMPPAMRAGHWLQARELLMPMSGPGATERLLARVALEWACLAPAPPTDRLFAMPAPSAWIVVQAGGADALVESLLAEADEALATPCLRISADSIDDDPFAAGRPNDPPTIALCDSFEHEAQCAAAQVLEHVRRAEVPVALIAQDRLLVRRVRALLERSSLRLLDETGWTLSTTRAAAQVMGLLRAARADASTDAVIDWLKGASWMRADDAAALSELEAACRRKEITRSAALSSADLAAAPARLWAMAAEILSGLSSVSRQQLPSWLTSLTTALTKSGALAFLQDDDAGGQVLESLRIAPNLAFASDWSIGANVPAMGYDQFRSWVDGALEQATFRPTPDFDGPAQVVVTPMARAMLRPFAAIVFPGADDKHLGASPSSPALLSDLQAAALGVPTSTQRRHAELLAFVQVAGAQRITFLRRRADEGDPLADSPLVERLSLALAAHGVAMTAWRDPRIELRLDPTPIRMTAPSAAQLIPKRLSASACEALRECPYRFFALNMLRLREDEELEREVEKRDYGKWLHEVLLKFHQDRVAPEPVESEIASLLKLANASRALHGLGDADFLPFSASFIAFAPRYVVWLHQRDSQGASWLEGEEELSIAPPEFEGTELFGIIDRVDEIRIEGEAAVELIDYKTGSASTLKEKVSMPLEDTQLAFYAALMRSKLASSNTEVPLSAIYLPLDGSKALEPIPHRNVEHSAATLLAGLAHDLRRLRAGTGMPALGEGSTCEHCAARGVCRRDHWTEQSAHEGQR